MSNIEVNKSLFPLSFGVAPGAPPDSEKNFPPTLQSFMDAVNNLNDRMTALENAGPGVADPNAVVFTAGMLAVLDECGAFFGVHRVVANTVDTRQNQPTANIDPATGLPKVEIPVAQPVAQQQTGTFGSNFNQNQPGA